MFVGSLNTDGRALLAEIAPLWKGRPVYVGCSGNFTIERVLAAQGVREIHGNDVTLYSTVVGRHLAGEPPLPLTVTDPALAWLKPHLEPGIPTIATLLLASEYLKVYGRPEPYYARMASAYEANWRDLHTRTVEKVGGKLIGAIAFTRATYLGGFCDAYMMTDLAIRPSVYRRLSKLVLATVFTHEVRAVLEQALAQRVVTIGTTAFTKKPISMKYRGMMVLHSRKDGALNYVGDAGKWSLAEALAWWTSAHSQDKETLCNR